MNNQFKHIEDILLRWKDEGLNYLPKVFLALIVLVITLVYVFIVNFLNQIHML